MGEKAGFGIRSGAFLLNALIVGVPMWIVVAVLRSSLPTEIEPCRVDGQARLCENLTTTSATVYVLVSLALGVAVLVGYYGYFDGVKGATPGRRAVGLQLVDRDSGLPIGLGRAVGRELFKIISAAVLLLGFLWVLWDRDKRAWHDMVANSAVIKSLWGSGVTGRWDHLTRAARRDASLCEEMTEARRAKENRWV